MIRSKMKVQIYDLTNMDNMYLERGTLGGGLSMVWGLDTNP